MKQISKAFILVLFVLMACQSSKKPQNPLLDSQTMAQFITELHFYESMVNNRYISDEQAPVYYRQLFEKHSITPQQFDSALVWYELHYKQYLEMYAIVRKNFEKETKKIESGIYNYYLPAIPSIWAYYGHIPANDTAWNTLNELQYYLQLPATELRTYNSRCHPYIERLRGTSPYWKIGNE